ncbi:MAG: DUF5652 family protein [Candidatus Magasanikbacteria bacterium]|jgi:hypothetical protein
MQNFMGYGVGSFFGFFGIFFVAFFVWLFYWKGRALWLAARKGNVAWFVVLLLVNTVGILEILYIYIFSKKSCCGGECVCSCKGDKKCEEKCCEEGKCEDKVEDSCGCGHEHK